MTKMEIDTGDLPASGEAHSLLLWIARFDDRGGRTQYVNVFLEGPGSWIEDLELYDPDVLNMPDTLKTGLYIINARVDYDLDKLAEPENVRLTILAYRPVRTPTREELRDMVWDPSRGMSA